MRKCYICKQDKNETEFHKNQHDCKLCHKIRGKIWRDKNLNHIKCLKKSWSDKNKKAIRESNKRHRLKFPEQPKARLIVYRLILKGIIKRAPCFVCGSQKAQAHHPDYSKPRTVVWLCHQHHVDIHNRKIFLQLPKPAILEGLV